MNKKEKLKILKLFVCFFKIGLFTFGGGFAMIPLMEKELVDKHHWVKKRDFINSIALTQSVPGAIAFNLAVYFGHDVMGIIGATVSVIAVALPSLFIILGIAVFFSTFSEIEIVQNIFKGIRPAVVALIMYAAINIATHLKWDWAMILLLASATLVSVFFSVNPILLIVGVVKNEALCLMDVLLSLFFSFFKIGLFGYGGGYAMISLIQTELLSNGWMSKAKFVDIIAIAQMTPGPIAVNSATFIGYELASFKGALVATFAVLLPSFILVNILAIYIKSVTHSRFTNSILQYLRPVIIALIINAAYTIAIDAIADYFSLFILGFSFFLIWKTKIHPIFIIALSGICGMVYYGCF